MCREGHKVVVMVWSLVKFQYHQLLYHWCQVRLIRQHLSIIFIFIFLLLSLSISLLLSKFLFFFLKFVFSSICFFSLFLLLHLNISLNANLLFLLVFGFRWNCYISRNFCYFETFAKKTHASILSVSSRAQTISLSKRN